jgi:SAM-dependent methyltransferase
MNENIYKKRTHCAICGNSKFKTFMKYGKMPLAGYFPKLDELKIDKSFDLNLIYCPKCSLLQTDSIIDPTELFVDYRYMSSIGLSKHFTEVAQIFKDRFKLDSNSKILEIGSNDGVLLLPLMNIGLNPIGIDPAENISEVARNKGANVITDFFTKETASKYFAQNGFDLIISNNCFAHIDDIHSIMSGIKYCLKPNGRFVIEVHYVKDLVEQTQYDTVYHEHLYYYSLTALSKLFEQYNLYIEDFNEIPIHGGSIRVTVKNGLTDHSDYVKKILEEENAKGYTNEGQALISFSEKSMSHIESLKTLLENLKSNKSKIIGYGASGRGNVMLNLCNIDSTFLDYVVDESVERIGRYVPKQNIPIVDYEFLENDDSQPEYILIIAWNYAKTIMEKLQGKNYKFIIPFPSIEILSNYEEVGQNRFII